MKAIKKIVILLIVVAVMSVPVFFFGWMQFSVPAGKYGVLLSKSGGYHRKPIVSGAMMWRWERLIPTNAKILIFDLSPRRVMYTTEGSLPSAGKYNKILNTDENFSWSFSADAMVTLRTDQLVPLVAEKRLNTQEELEKYIDSIVKSTLQNIFQRYLTVLLDDPYEYQKIKTDYHDFSEQIKKELLKKTASSFTIDTISISDVMIPDLHSYKLAEQAYSIYEQKREMLLAETAAQEAQRAASEQFQIERLTKWGEFLSKYPHIIELIAVAQKDSKAVIEALQSLDKKIDPKKTAE